MHEVIVKIKGETIKINVSRVFRGRNPVIKWYSVNIMDDDSGKQIRLFCEDQYNQEEADILVQIISEGKITDLTGYLAEWKKIKMEVYLWLKAKSSKHKAIKG